MSELLDKLRARHKEACDAYDKSLSYLANSGPSALELRLKELDGWANVANRLNMLVSFQEHLEEQNEKAKASQS